MSNPPLKPGYFDDYYTNINDLFQPAIAIDLLNTKIHIFGVSTI